MLEYSKLPIDEARKNFFSLYLILKPKNPEDSPLPIEDGEDYDNNRKE